jgi:endonuclease/exonuclease/phosphatase family metal-dependent hydrolase
MTSSITLAALVLALVPAPDLAPASEPVSAAAEPRSESVRVGTFNIRYANDGDGPNAWRHRRAIVCGILRECDFWGLQEALPSQIDEIKAARPEYGFVARTREADAAQGEACPILYRSDRWTLDPMDHGTFWLSETPDAAGSKSWDSSLPRIATYARFTAKDGARGIYVFNTHLDHKGAQARLAAATILAQRIKARRHAGDPVVLLGDFNCGPTSDPVKALLGDAAVGLRDAWRETNPSAPEQPTFNGWADACTGERIDFIFVAGGLDTESAAIESSKRDGRWPSDHAFVRAEFVWKP